MFVFLFSADIPHVEILVGYLTIVDDPPLANKYHCIHPSVNPTREKKKGGGGGGKKRFFDLCVASCRYLFI